MARKSRDCAEAYIIWSFLLPPSPFVVTATVMTVRRKGYAAQANPKIDAARAEKDPFRMETG